MGGRLFVSTSLPSKYAKQLENVSIAEVVARAGINEPYKAEIAKGRNLAPFVILIDDSIVP